MRIRRATRLTYLGSRRRPAGFRHFYAVDGREVSFFTSIARVGLCDHSQSIAAANLALANLIDLYSVTLPREVVLEGIGLDRNGLDFWERTARNIAAERLVEDALPARMLDAKWSSRSALRGPMRPLDPSIPRTKLLAMSGGKESLAALKMMNDPLSCSLFFLDYRDSGQHHGTKLWKFFDRTHNCFKVRTDVVRMGSLLREFHCTSYGMFVIGQIAFSALLLMDRFSEVAIGNEFSANFGNGMHDGIPVNHQYDKSYAFAQDLNTYLSRHVTEEFTHTSPFWDWYEYRIARDFFADDRYLKQWTSCNNATATKWFCGTCAKCAFVFLLGAAHTDPQKIRRLMGANMLEDVDLIQSLADPDARKPLECVGTREEAWVALEDIWLKKIWRKSPGLIYYSQCIRPLIAARLPAMRKELLRDQSLP